MVDLDLAQHCIEIITLAAIIFVLMAVCKRNSSENFIPGDPFGISLSRYTFNDSVATGAGSNAYLEGGGRQGVAYRDMTGMRLSSAMIEGMDQGVNPGQIGSNAITDPSTGLYLKGPSWGASAKDSMTGDMPTIGFRQNFNNEAPVFYPMADEAYLNKYLYGMDASTMTLAARTAVADPIISRLNAPGTASYGGYGDKGVYQATNDYLTVYNLGGGPCRGGNYVLDTSTCPEQVVRYAPGSEGFQAISQSGLNPGI